MIKFLLGLLVSVLVAVAIGLLIAANFVLASIVWNTTVTLLAAAVVASMCVSGKSRAFWIGFSVFGGGHMTLAFCDQTCDLLLSKQILESCAKWFGHEWDVELSAARIWGNLGFSLQEQITVSDAYLKAVYGTKYYMIVGLSLFSVVVGCCGGLLGRWFYAKRERLREQDGRE